jgi:hypothetical protein
MKVLISTMVSFMEKILMVSLIGSGIALLAGEIRVTALKKAYQGSSKLSGFTQKMTGMNFP